MAEQYKSLTAEVLRIPTFLQQLQGQVEQQVEQQVAQAAQKIEQHVKYNIKQVLHMLLQEKEAQLSNGLLDTLPSLISKLDLLFLQTDGSDMLPVVPGSLSRSPSGSLSVGEFQAESQQAHKESGSSGLKPVENADLCL